MAAEREPPTLADYVVTALSPVLIMLMVGSLVFFLITVLPTGDYKERLLYTTFFFVFGAVLVARIAIQYDAARATVYGAGLALVTFLAMSAYVEYPRSTGLKSVGWLLNLGLMGLIWWSAHKLTWDCTHIDENRDASGRGLLAAAGLAESGSESGSENKDDNELVSRESQTSAGDTRAKKKKKKRREPSLFSAWVGRWRAFREKQKDKPHTPGVWVVYFALAALPLFAVGQSLIPPDDAARRWATFAQMAVYVGSALGLLVTTSLLGLRRYLRQRKVKMPAAFTASWLGLGGVLIVMFLALGAFLPRPHSEVPWFGLPQAGKAERDASKYAQLRDSAGKGEGNDGNTTEKGDGSEAGKNSEAGGAKGEKESGRSKSNTGRKTGGEKGKDGESRNGDTKDGENGKDGNDGDTDREGRDTKEQSGDRDRSGSRSPPDTKLGAAVQKVAGFLKWVVVAVVVFLILVALVLGVLRYLAPFTDWARSLLDGLQNWWAGLFGKKKGRAPEEAVVSAGRGPQRPPPFTAFSNPFEDGTTAGRDAAELVEYTFAALDSWAWDRGHGRPATETPLEFAARVGNEFPDFDAPARQLAALYARVAYSDLPVPAGAPKLLEQVWDQLVHGVTAAEPVEVE